MPTFLQFLSFLHFLHSSFSFYHKRVESCASASLSSSSTRNSGAKSTERNLLLQLLQLLRLGFFFLGGRLTLPNLFFFFLVVATTAAPHSWRQRPPFRIWEHHFLFFIFFTVWRMSKQVSLRSVEFSLLLPGFPDVFAFLKKQNKCRDFLRAKLLSSAIEGGGYGGWKSLRFRICVTLRNSNGSLNIPIGQRRMTNRVRSASASSWSSNPSGSKGDQRWPCRKPRVAVRGVTWLVHLLRNFVLNWIKSFLFLDKFQFRFVYYVSVCYIHKILLKILFA